MESQKPCRKLESKTSDRKMESNKKKRRNKNIDPKKNKKEKTKDSHLNKEKSTGDKLFLRKVGKDEMQEILVIPQTELQDFTNLECLTTLQLPRVSIPLIGESPEESYEDPESVVNGSEKCSDTRTIVISDQFDPTYESNCEGVWGNSNTHGDTCNMFPSESLSGNDSLGRIDATFEDIRDKMQEIKAIIQTELQALKKAERNRRLFSVVNWKVYFLEQADPSEIVKLDSNVVVGLIKSSHLQELILDISPKSDSLVHESQPVTLQTFQGIMQRKGLPVNPQLYEPLEHSNTTNVSEELSHVVKSAEDCQSPCRIDPYLKGSRPFSVVNSKVHLLEQAHASDIALLDSDVVVGLTKSSHLQEIILDISPKSDSLVHESQPVTLQTFQGIMQRMGLPVNPQLSEPLEHSNTTNDSEELSYVEIFDEDCRKFYYIPVLRGSLLQRKDAREREEPVNPWTILLKENSNTTNVEDCHVPVQSLRPSNQTIDYINTLLPPK